MSLPSEINPHLLATNTGYNLTRSLRFRNSASAGLSKTVAAVGDQQKYTYSGWIKRGLLSGQDVTLFASWTNVNNYTAIYFANAASTMRIVTLSGGTAIVNLQSAAVFRDPSAWYHFVVSVDTTQATAADRVRFYVNNVQNTSFVTHTTQPSQNANILMGVIRGVGYDLGGGYFDGYMAEVNFIDGQALTPASFGSTNALTGVWQPARYTGTYGTNGFYLPFTDNSALTTSSNVGLGKDFSGNGNYWTTNNISITAGVTYDSMTDVPTLTSATAANFAVLNPLAAASAYTVSGGNLNYSGTASTTASYYCRSTMAIPSGKFYFEFVASSLSANALTVGIQDITLSATTGLSNQSTGAYGYFVDGSKETVAGLAAYGASWGAGDVIGVAFDSSAGSLTFYKNNTSQGVAFTGITGSYCAFVSLATAGVSKTIVGVVNFGQRPFTYTPPTGFVALNTYNLPTSTIVKGNTVMDATLYTGTLLSNAVTNAASFKPDLVWLKSRSAATDNKLTDSVRGVTKGLISNTTGAETTDTQGLTAFGSAGFTVGTDTVYNNLAATYVAWQWQAGQGSSSSNTNGTITSTVSVNASAGFSVVTYTGTGTNGATVGHGLGVAPAFYIVKTRGVVGNWQAYHSALTGTTAILLDSTGAAFASSVYWNNTNPTSSVFSLGTSSFVNVASQTQVAYCWTPIAGFSAFGSYTGNGSTDGTFVYTGFQPKFVMMKSTSTGGWVMMDTARNPYNVEQNYLYGDSSAAEAGGNPVIDALSNGFKIRTTWTDINPSGTSVIYAAFASNPFKNSLAQ